MVKSGVVNFFDPKTIIHIVGKCLLTVKSEVTTFTHNVGKCFWVKEIDTTTFNNGLGKCYWVKQVNTTHLTTNGVNVCEKYLKIPPSFIIRVYRC